MTDAAESNGWLLLTLAVCTRCGSPFAPVTAGRDRRFYICRCDSLRDANPLHTAIVAAAADHNRRCTPAGLRPYIVVRKWATATPDQLIRFLHHEVAHITVDVDGSARCFWHRGHTHPTQCRPDRSRAGHDHRREGRTQAVRIGNDRS